MSQLIIVTTPTNSGDGTPLATAFNYCNSNFGELYARAQVSPPVTLTGTIGDQAGMYAYDSSYFYYCFADYDGSTIIWGQVTQIANVSIAAINNGDSNVKIVGNDGDATVNINGTSNVAVFKTTGLRVTGEISATGNVNGLVVNGGLVNGNLVTGNNISAVGNVVAQNAFLTGAITTGTGFATTSRFDPLVFDDGVVMDYDEANSKARFSTGAGDSINFYNNGVGNTEIVTFDQYGNIESMGGFSATGNIETQGVISAVGNIITDGYFVGTFVGNVTGNFVIPGSNTQVVFNTSGNADAVGGFTYNKDSNTMTVLGVVSAAGNVVAGNVRTAGQVSATGTITGGALNTSGAVSATGNVTSGNVLTGGFVTATGNVTGGNLRTAGLITATGNVTGGNVTTAGQISATGNIRTANYLFVTQDINVGGDITATSYTGTDLSLTGNVTSGNVNAAGGISASGNVSGNYVFGNIVYATGIAPDNTIQSGNSNVLIGSSAGNISVNVNGVSPVALFTPLGQINTGYMSASGNVIGGNLVTSGLITTGSNVIGGNFNTNGVVSAAGNVRGANLNTDGIVSSTGNIITGANLVTVGTTINSGVSTSGTVTGANLVVSNGGTLLVGNIINSNANGVGNIGNSTNYFNTVFAKATSAQYADLAENYASDVAYDAGTVVIFGGEEEITTTDYFADVRVAGAISTDPAYLMNSGAQGLPVALRGRVPVKVIGPVRKGDLLVTAGDNPGYAISIGQRTDYPLAVFAKSIETNTNEGVKVITAVII